MGNKEDLGLQWSEGNSHKKRILVAISQNAKHLVVKITHGQNSGTLQKSWFLGMVRILRYASNNNTVFTRVSLNPVYK